MGIAGATASSGRAPSASTAARTADSWPSRRSCQPASRRAQLLVAARGGQCRRVLKQRHAVLDVEQRVAQRLVRARAGGRAPSGAALVTRPVSAAAGRVGTSRAVDDGLELRQHRAGVRRARGEQCGLGAAELAPEVLPVGPELRAEDAQLAQRAVLSGVHATEYGRLSRRDRRRAPRRRGRPRRCAPPPGRPCPR